MSLIVIFWTSLFVFKFSDTKISWPVLQNAVSISLHKDSSCAAIWNFESLSTGTANLLVTTITAVVMRLPAAVFARCAIATWFRVKSPFKCHAEHRARISHDLFGTKRCARLGVSAVGPLFVLLLPFWGSVAVILCGSDTSGYALSGNLQVIVANQIKLDPVLYAAKMSPGGVIGKRYRDHY